MRVLKKDLEVKLEKARRKHYEMDDEIADLRHQVKDLKRLNDELESKVNRLNRQLGEAIGRAKGVITGFCIATGNECPHPPIHNEDNFTKIYPDGESYE